MKKIRRINGKLSVLFIAAILILCTGFLIVSCGNEPQRKAKDANKGPYAVDFNSCPAGSTCSMQAEVEPAPDVSNTELTVEAWVKSKGTSGGVFSRLDDLGVALIIDHDQPKFAIRRLPAGDVPIAQRTALTECVQRHVTSSECIVPAITQVDGSISNIAAIFTIPGAAQVTSTISSVITARSASLASTFIPHVTSTVTQIQLIAGSANYVNLPAGTYQAYPTPGQDSNTFSATVVASIAHTADNLVQDVWTHIAGVLTTEDQSDNGNGPNNCATVGAEQPHLAIYIKGVLNNCASTNEKYADNSLGHKIIIGDIQNGGPDSLGSRAVDFVNPGGNLEAVVDEVRLWLSARTESEIQACMFRELGIGGTCDRGDGNLAAYYRLNEGEGSDVTDSSGSGMSGSLLLPGDIHWEDGWVDGNPHLKRVD